MNNTRAEYNFNTVAKLAHLLFDLLSEFPAKIIPKYMKHMIRKTHPIRVGGFEDSMKIMMIRAMITMIS